MSSNTISRLLIANAMVALSTVAGAQEATTPSASVDAVPAQTAGSSVRIVRVSQVSGAVRMDRNTGRGYESAFANIPVVAGTGLRTAQGVAEVEFEDNSSLRLAPESEIRFTKLSRMPTGGTVTTVEVVKGLVYVSLEKTKGNSFSLKQGVAETTLAPGAHIRLDARETEGKLAVLDGEAAVQMNGTLTTVAKHQTVDVNPTAQTVSTVVHGTEEGQLDAWDKQGQQYHRMKAIYGGSGGGQYGASDLSYYGSFVNMPGCGSMWRPYFANAAWDPYGAGVWAFYPGTGYSWVSPYPWGWLPFHSGSWISCGAAGWGWQPGNTWYGLNNVAMMQTLKRPVGHPLPTPPPRNSGNLVPVNMRNAAFSSVSEGNRFTFRENSAGLGVPRQTFGHLNGASAALQHGSVASGQVTAGTLVRGSSVERQGGVAGMTRTVPMPGNAGEMRGGFGSQAGMRGSGAGTMPPAYSGAASAGAPRGGVPAGGSSMGSSSMGGSRMGSGGGAPMSAPAGGTSAGASGGGARH